MHRHMRVVHMPCTYLVDEARHGRAIVALELCMVQIVVLVGLERELLNKYVGKEARERYHESYMYS